MKRFSNYIYTHQATVLSLSLTVMVSSSFYFMLDVFNHLA